MHRTAIQQLITMALVMVMSFTAKGQDIITSSGESIGKADIHSVTATNPIYSINPSMMSSIKKAAISVSCVMPYGMSELKQITGKGVVETKLANIAMQVGQSGDDDSHYTHLGGGLSRSFGKWAMGLEYYALIHTLTDNHKYTSSFSRLGLSFSPNEQWLLSVALNNIEQREIEYELSSVKISPIWWTALKWKGSDMFSLMLEVEKHIDYKAICKTAIGIYPVNNLEVTVGFSSKGQSLSAGAGYKWHGIGINAGLMYHEQLGVSSGASVSYDFGNR